MTCGGLPSAQASRDRVNALAFRISAALVVIDFCCRHLAHPVQRKPWCHSACELWHLGRSIASTSLVGAAVSSPFAGHVPVKGGSCHAQEEETPA